MRWLIIILAATLSNKIFILGKKANRHHSYRRQQNQHANISKLLDKLLENYDNSLRPDFGFSPAVIEIDLMVRSMGSISEIEMTYSMDCYFRQSWIDKRLAFKDSTNNITTLALSISMLKKIWKPDTFFFNGKQSYLHTITTPNKFVRLFNDGRVLYSSRLTVKAACFMSLENYPMDVQRCPLKLGSFGYTNKDVLYRWNSRAVAISDDLRMSQFDLIDVPSSNESIRVGEGYTGKETDVKEFSVLLVSFHLQRHMGNFLIQVYGPCILLVVLSWVSFWLNREATADRISLGITTVLTMTFLGLEARTDLPKVSYPTALDFFVFLSFVFIFATILQFAFVHYFTKYGSGECYYNYYETSSESESDDNEASMTYFPQSSAMSTTSHVSSMSQIEDDIYGGVIPLSRLELDIELDDTRSIRVFKSFRRFIGKYILCLSYFEKEDDTQSQNDGSQVSINNSTIESEQPSEMSTYTQNTPRVQRRQMKNSSERYRRTQFNSVSKIDKFSRFFFPFLFFVINVFYWCFYLTQSQRK